MTGIADQTAQPKPPFLVHPWRIIMSKAQDTKKETRKEPAKTMKEKKEAKKVKKEEKKRG